MKHRKHRKHTKRTCSSSNGYEQLKQEVQAHYNDGLEIAKQLHPFFASEEYLTAYSDMEEKLQAQGYDVVQRSYFHMCVRHDILEKLRLGYIIKLV